jgi:hypothetical protein
VTYVGVHVGAPTLVPPTLKVKPSPR